MSYYYSSRPAIPTVTKNLLTINILVYFLTLLGKSQMYTMFSLYFPLSHNFRIWQIVTHMFMHGGFWHLFFNMYALYMFGSVVENIIGKKKFLIFYFLCGIGAALMHLGVEWITFNYSPIVGASGAIYGILIAYAMLFPDSKLTLIFPPISLSAKWWVAIFVAIELVTGITGTADGIAHFAHLGGMLVGWLTIMYWKKKGNLFDRD